MMHRRLSVTNPADAENTPPDQNQGNSQNQTVKGPLMMPLSPHAGNLNHGNFNGNIAGGNSGNNNTHNAIHNSNEQIFQLQIEIQSLKQRLKLASGASKNELLAVLSEKETVIQSKSKQITTLNEKFHKITKAVGRMEKEVAILRKDNEEYEGDNKKLKRHLNIREKEVTALVQRCTLQEEKLGEGKSARLLEKQLVDMKKILEQTKGKLQEMEILQQTLNVTQKQKEEAVEQVEVLTRDKQSLTAALQDTKENYSKQLREKDEAIALSHRNLSDVKALKEKQDADCARLNTTLNECNIRMSDMNKDMQNLRNEHDAKVKELERQLKENEEKARGVEDQHSFALAQLRAEQQEQVRKMEKQLASKDEELTQQQQTIKNVEQEKHLVSTTLEEMQLERDDLAVARDQDKVLHGEQMKIMKESLDAKSNEIETLEGLVQELGDHRAQSGEEIIVMKEKIVSLEAEVKAANGREESLRDDGRSRADAIAKLENDLQTMQENTRDMEEQYKEKVAATEDAQNALKDEYEGMLIESEEQLKEMDAQYEAERNKVEKLRTEIDQMTSHSERQEQLRQMEMKLLEDSVKAAKLQSDSNEKELKSKLAELMHEREKSSELEAALKMLEKASSQEKMSSTVIVDELKKALQEGTVKYAKLEEERDTIISESRKAVDVLKDKISDLDGEFTNLKAEIVSKDSQLEQRQTTIDSLVKAKGELESKIISYRTDLEMLMKAYDGTKEEYSKAVRSLEEEKKQLKKEKDDDYYAFKTDYQQLQALASESQDEVDKLQSTNESLKSVVEDKENIIKNIDHANKDLQKKFDEKDSLISDLQAKLEICMAEGDEIKKKSAQFRLEKEKEVFQHLDAVESEKSARVALEAKVQKLEGELEAKKRDFRESSELKAANFLLQDKIDRQEAYLKRKLHKEKVLKERMKPIPHPAPLPAAVKSPSKGKPRKSLSESKIPMRSPPSRSRSLTRRPSLDRRSLDHRSLDRPSLDSQRAYVARTRSSSIGIRKAPSEDELDAILNGDTV